MDDSGRVRRHPGLLRWGLVGLALVSCACGTTRGGSSLSVADRDQAQAATRAGNWSQAASLWHTLFITDPARPAEACGEAARALIRLEEPESASELLDLGLAKHPEHPDLLTLKGEALVAMRFRRAAEECFERALRVDPRRIEALIALGKLRIDLGLESSAVEPLQRAVDITGGDFDTLRLLAKAQREAGFAPKAYASWVQAFSKGPGTVDDLVEAATLFLDDSFRGAHPESGDQMCAWLHTAVARDPQCVRAHFQLGVLCEEMGRREEAIEHYRRAVEIDPGCLMALTNLAILYSNCGDEPNAREMVVRALALEQDGNRRRALQKLLDPFEKSGETP